MTEESAEEGVERVCVCMGGHEREATPVHLCQSQMETVIVNSYVNTRAELRAPRFCSIKI